MQVNAGDIFALPDNATEPANNVRHSSALIFVNVQCRHRASVIRRR